MGNKPLILVLGYTSDITGSAVALLRLLEAAEDDAEFIVAAHPQGHLYHVASKKGWQVIALKAPLLIRSYSPVHWMRALFLAIYMSYCFRKIVLMYRPSVCLVNCIPNIGWLPGYWSLVVKSRPKIVWLVHELVLQPEWLSNLFRRMAQRYSHQVMGVSRRVCSNYPGKAHWLPNCVRQSANALIHNPFSEDKLHLLWVGTASPRKGLHLLVHKIRSLKQNGWNVQLELVASVQPKYRDYLYKCIEALRNIPIIVQATENEAHPSRFYVSNKIFIQTPVLPESFNLSALEAMSSGLLVFTSGRGGIEDFGRHAENLFFWERLNQPFGKELHTLKGDRAYCHKIQQQAVNTANRFSPEATSERFRDALDAIHAR